MRYRDDPRWITVRYPGQCQQCKAPIAQGERAFYYPNGKALLGTKCGHADEASASFSAEAADEEMLTGRY